MRFSTCIHRKTNVNFQTIFDERNYVGENYKTPNLVEIGSQVAPSQSCKYHSLVTIVLPFLKKTILPTGHNSGLIRTLVYHSNDVFCLATVPFSGCGLSNSLFRPTKHQNFDPLWTLPICSENYFSIRALTSKLPSNVEIIPHTLHF